MEVVVLPVLIGLQDPDPGLSHILQGEPPQGVDPQGDHPQDHMEETMTGVGADKSSDVTFVQMNSVLWPYGKIICSVITGIVKSCYHSHAIG